MNTTNHENNCDVDIFDVLNETAKKTKSHTHKTVEQILDYLKVGSFERLFLWLAKTDYYALTLTTFHSRLTLSGLGMMVIFTGLIAFTSATYSLHSMLVAPDIALHWPIVILIALIYALGIMIIDREIVGAISMNWKAIMARFVFALFIATAVSYPVKLIFFEGRINAEVNQMIDERNADKLQKIESLKQTGEPVRQKQLESINKQISIVSTQQDAINNQFNAEIQNLTIEHGVEMLKRNGRGTNTKGIENQIAALNKKRKEQTAELRKEQSELTKKLNKLSVPGNLPDSIQAEIKKLEGEIEEEKHTSYDFLSKYQALERIGERSGTSFYIMSTFILLFFMMLELVPLALKLSLGRTEYHYYMEARSNLSNQKIIGVTNLVIEALQKDPSKALRMSPEITNHLAKLIEDEASDYAETDVQPEPVLKKTSSKHSAQSDLDIDPPTVDEPMQGSK